MTTIGKWIQETIPAYFGNATAARDYRVQLRGNRSVLLFGLYLVILIGVATFTYSQVAANSGNLPVQAQEALQTFYQVIMVLLAGMISVITPALSATTVVSERMRRSFDLIFSAPVTPRYYLVGKMVSSFRFTWMLLILALPVTAASVVLGGASWWDVLSAYALLSMSGLVFTAIALLMSTIAPKPVSAVLWSYAATGLYLIVSLTGASTVGRMGAGMAMPFTVAMNPFYVVQAAGTYTEILGFHVSNLILAALATFLITKITLLAAGSVLSPYGSAEKRRLRIHGLVYFAGIAYACTYAVNIGSPSGLSAEGQMFVGMVIVWLAMLLVFVAPFMICHGYDGERRNWPNGLFSFRHVLDGSPAGALPYMISLILVTAVSAIAGALIGHGILPGPITLCYIVYAIGFWTLMWGIGRATSVAGPNIRNARALMFTAWVIFTVLPIPFLSGIIRDVESLKWLWNLSPVYPLTQSDTWRAMQVLAYGGAMMAAGLTVGNASERKMLPKMRADLVEDERIYGRA